MANPGGGFRYMARVLAHNPLQGDDAQRYLWLLGLPIDGCIEKLNQGIHDRLCFDATPTALQYIGSDRQIPRGLTETDASYAFRCSRALEDWGRAGSAWALLAQTLSSVLSKRPRGVIVEPKYDSSGTLQSTTWDRYDAPCLVTNPPIHTLDSVGNFDWDSLSPTNGSWGWWRWYLILFSTGSEAWIGSEGLWGDPGKWGDGGAWGVDQPSSVARAIVAIAKVFKAQVGHWFIISFDDEPFSYSAPVGGGINPDGHFGRWSKVVDGVYVPSRFSTARYFEGPR